MIEIRVRIYGTPLTDSKECAIRNIVRHKLFDISDCDAEAIYCENEGEWRKIL